MAFNIEAVRTRFPALQHDQVFFDNLGGSQVLGSVIDSVHDYLSNTNVQLGGSYAVSRKSTARYNASFEAGARYVNARVDEIVFGASATQLWRNLSQTFNFKPGDEIVVSAIDHEAHIAPWVDMAERLGLVLKWWKPERGTNPQLLPADLQGLISPRTRLVTCTHASNVLGTITDIRAIADVAHSVGALVCVDGVAYAPHRPIDVKALGVDFYTFAWYKVYGPHVAMMYGSWTAQTSMKSLGYFFNSHVTLADKIGLAGGSYELCQAITEVVDYLGTAGSDMWTGIIAHEKRLQSVLIDYLSLMPGITIYGMTTGYPDVRLATISFTVNNWSSRDFVEAVESNTNYGFKWGSFYSPRLVRDTLGLGNDGVIRVSMVHYNTMDEVLGLIKAMERVMGATQ